jgi:ABC-type bacteriocin/lantibiotic exporter with double-glycine peptidase domain
MLLGNICGLASPYLLGMVIDKAIPSGDKTLLAKIILLIVIVNIFRFIFGTLSEYLSTKVSSNVILDIKEKLFRNLLELPFPYFEKNKPGEIIQIISQEVDKIQSFLTKGLIRFINNVFTILSLTILLCYLNYKLFLITFAVLPLVIILNSIISRRVRKLVKATGEKEGELYNFYFERIKNISVVKTFYTIKHEVSKLKRKVEFLNILYLKNSKLTALGNNGSFFFISLLPVIVLFMGGFQVIENAMTIGALVAFIQYSNRLIPPASDFLNLYVDYIKAHESSKRIAPFLNPKTNVGKKENPNVQLKTISRIRCSNLGFNVNEKAILSNINIELVAGKNYVIMGANGAGKSTLIKILSKFYMATSGEVIINETYSIEEVPIKYWFKKVVVISQDAQIFHETIAANLLYANNNILPDDMWRSLETVDLKLYVESLTDSLDTKIGDGENAANPSGGQRQKLSLARLFLKEADVIILDEVTSAMDSKSSRVITSHILKTYKDKIVISITHKIQDTFLFDRVILMDSGKLSENGTPKDLLQSSEKFRSFLSSDSEVITCENDIL